MAKIPQAAKSALAVIALLAGCAGLYFFVFGNNAGADLAADVNNPEFIDEDGNVFRHKVDVGTDGTTIKGPSGKQGYPVEYCWWTKDGKIRETGFPVLLEEWKGKPGPTWCPDCNRQVRPNNPRPQSPSDRQPPTKPK